MDGERFDDLVKKFCTTRLTRLSALRGLAGGAAAVLTGAVLASDETEAKKAHGQNHKKKARGQNHKKHRAQNQNKKVRSQSQDLTAQVQADATCRAGGHPCEGSQTCCQDPFTLTCIEGVGSGKAERCCLPGSEVCGSGNTAQCCPGEATCNEANTACVCPGTRVFCGFLCCAEGATCTDAETGTCSTPECVDNEDCDPDEICDNGVCIPECDSSDDCDNNEVCCGDPGVCFTGECCIDGDCPAAEPICTANHQCVECEVDGDCPENEVCNDQGVCVPECTDDTTAATTRSAAAIPGSASPVSAAPTPSARVGPAANHQCVNTPPAPTDLSRCSLSCRAGLQQRHLLGVRPEVQVG